MTTTESLAQLLTEVAKIGDELLDQISSGTDVSAILQLLDQRNAFFEQFASASTDAGVNVGALVFDSGNESQRAALYDLHPVMASVVQQNAVLQQKLAPLLETAKDNLNAVQQSIVLRDKYRKSKPQTKHGILLDQHT